MSKLVDSVVVSNSLVVPDIGFSGVNFDTVIGDGSSGVAVVIACVVGKSVDD